MSTKHKNSILIALLLGNPLLLLLLTKSWVGTLAMTLSLIVAAFYISNCKSLRLKVWAFNLCALSSIALHGELIFRTFCQDKNIPNLYELHGTYYFNKPLLDKEFRTHEYVSTYKTNCQGYRMSDLFNPHDTIRKCDWLFIGDSFTQGAQVNYDELYTSRLFAFFPHKVILNGGISGAGLYDELNFFKDHRQELSPKVVFLQIGVFNDFFGIKKHRASYQDYILAHSDLYRYLAYTLFSTDSLPLGRWTEPFFPTIEDNRDYNILFKEESEIKKADRKAFKTCIREWKQEVEKMGANLVLLLIPSKEQVSPTLLKEVIDNYPIAEEQLDMTAPNRLFSSVASSLGLQAIDLTSAFRHSDTFPFFLHDEHLNQVGHQLIADVLAKELSAYADSIEYRSKTSTHERYPLFQVQDSSLTYQAQDANEYFILKKLIQEGHTQCLIQSFEELVHPVLSQDMRYLAYTEGNQENSETDVILYDCILSQSEKLNPNGLYAAIPMFSHSGKKMAMPLWNKSNHRVANIYIYDRERKAFDTQIKSAEECWRPIFSLNDKEIYFIQKGKFFAIKKYNPDSQRIQDVLSLPFDIWDITLSPSGKHLIFAGNKDGNWDLFSYTFTTQQVKQLTYTLGNEWDPAFGSTDEDLWYAGTFGFNDGIFYRRIKL